MNTSQIVNQFHKIVILYISLGWMIENQRKYLLFFLPSIQFQFLINDNMCILTQLENKLLERASKTEEISDSFIDKTMRKYNIQCEPSLREKIIHTALYASFCLNYFLSQSQNQM